MTLRQQANCQVSLQRLIQSTPTNHQTLQQAHSVISYFILISSIPSLINSIKDCLRQCVPTQVQITEESMYWPTGAHEGSRHPTSVRAFLSHSAHHNSPLIIFLPCPPPLYTQIHPSTLSRGQAFTKERHEYQTEHACTYTHRQ